MRTMLITGGTGAIGSESVRALAAEPSVDRIAVLTRTPSGAGRERLLESWRASAKIPVGFARGSLQTLTDAASDMRSDVTHIVHLAADTRFSAPLHELRATNVGGLEAVLAYARTCPRLEAVVVASTVYVAGLRTGLVRERDLPHDSGFANPYEQSKHEMEHVARSAMRELPVSVYRLSTAVGDERTGAVGSLNAFHTALRLMYGGLVPMVPGSRDTPIDIVSTGYAAGAIQRLIAAGFEPARTYHVCAGKSAPMLGDVLDTAMRTMRARRPAWRRRAIELPVLADERTYELFVRSVQESGDAMMIGATQAVDSFARQLTRPKVFDTTHADATLSPFVPRPDPLALCEGVVGYCVENEWRTAA